MISEGNKKTLQYVKIYMNNLIPFWRFTEIEYNKCMAISKIIYKV